MALTSRPLPRHIGRFLRALALPLFAAVVHCGEGALGPGAPGPSIISPQPIPENATGVLLDEASLNAFERDGALVVRARATGPVPGTTSLTVTNLNGTTAGTVVTVTLGEAFEVTVPGGLGDTLRIEETQATSLAVDVRFAADGRGTFFEPCFSFEGNARNALLPSVAVGAANSIKVVIENQCGQELRLVETHVFHASTSPALDLAGLTSTTLAAGVSASVLIPMRANEAGDISSLVVVVAADRTAMSLRFRGSAR